MFLQLIDYQSHFLSSKIKFKKLQALYWQEYSEIYRQRIREFSAIDDSE